LTPKPLYQLKSKPQRLPRCKRMSVAIGSRYIGGLAVCTDSKIVLEDGSTRVGCKLIVSQNTMGTFAIANSSTDDGNAGAVLADEILADIADLKRSGTQPLIEAIKSRMRKWHAGYGSPGEKPPRTHFIIAAVGKGYSAQYFCEPPQTVIDKHHEPLAIGAGSAVVEPLLPTILFGASQLEPTILKLAFLMYRAKKEQALVGGPTDLVLINMVGNYKWIPREEFAAAEDMGEFVDLVLRDCCLGLLSRESENEQRRFLKIFNEMFSYRSRVFRNIQFPSLREFMAA
jgi:hypothetical protein